MYQLIRNVSELAAICAPLFFLSQISARDALTTARAPPFETTTRQRLFDWLADVLSYQGVSDAIAERYMDEHGSMSFYEIEDGLRQRPSCPRLTSYWQFARHRRRRRCVFAQVARLPARAGLRAAPY